ncbi:tyrosine-type recombinase/integrase [Paenibacillus sp. LMG 31458]|uniref:Tyrosine-type recombinase/integrase n=1 Tax=Paenibacillus phytorum TaxID=2654977 RepID=A0ABX1XR16_9BACL|nr:tyrosine-type recombinase/integrase [Paenibacillus phytorum]NOU70719.1 tyrosine-type recombinase/integrase [Paenibacillus phytorum]
MQKVNPIRDRAKIKEIQDILLKRSLRDWLLFTTGINSGLHLNDLLQLKVKDVKGKNVIQVKEEKTGKEKSFDLIEELHLGYQQYLQHLDDEEYVFCSKRTGVPIKRIHVYRILNKAAKEAGLNEVGTQTLRKTYGYHVYQTTKDVSVLKELFNQSAPSVTLKYIGVSS